MTWILIIIAVPLSLWAIARFYLRGEDLSRYDGPRQPVEVERSTASTEHTAVVQMFEQYRATQTNLPNMWSEAGRQAIRLGMEQIPAALDLGVGNRVVDVLGIPAEWVLAPGADPNRRLLYLHGGAFTTGSAKSHRVFTATLSKRADAAVLAIDYRLMPENKRMDGVRDFQTAYRWIIDNGPDGPAPAETLFVAGDSAGGNLTLMIAAWARDHGLRQPDAAVALSPGTDSTAQSPSWGANVETDQMLGPMFGFIAKLPQTVALWWQFISNRVRPCNPVISPIHGDLAGLPPTLVHASEAEMLLDDSRRYVNKAQAAGSPVTLQTWPHVMHVWHGLALTVPEAQEAFDRIIEFLDACAPRAAGQTESGSSI